MKRTLVLIDPDGGVGYELVIASSGRQALNLVQSGEEPLVVVLGESLPDMSLREFLAHLTE